MNYQILTGDNRITLKTLPNDSIDAIITDPPYGIDFLGKSWDANTGALETYQECLRVLKPGGHILAFSAARTYHHLAITLEQAGFEIRDQIMWIYSSGFPKSQDIGKQIHKKENGKLDKQHFDPAIMIKVDGDNYKHPDTDKVYRKLPDINGDNLAKSHEGSGYGCVFQEVVEVNNEWSGWGTQLKPAHEPIALARKPLDKGLSIARNCQTHGVGALNIDAGRVKSDDLQKIADWYSKDPTRAGTTGTFNNILSEAQDKPRVDRVDAVSDSTKAQEDILKGRFPSNVLGDIPDYQKYFYCPKVSRRERHIGFDTNDIPVSTGGILDTNGEWSPEHWHGENGQKQIATEASMLADMGGYYVDENNNETKLGGKNIWLPQTGHIYIHGLKEEYRKWCVANNKTPNVGNNHPTVKPIELMKYLIKLITPPGGTVLDPFNGSGSTGCAAVELGHPYIGCELDPAYVEIATKRIEAWYEHTRDPAKELFE